MSFLSLCLPWCQVLCNLPHLLFSIFDIFGARLFDETLFSCSGQCDQPMVVIGGMSLIIWDVLCVFVLFALFHF